MTNFKKFFIGLVGALALTPATSATAQSERILPSVGIMAGQYGSAQAVLGEELGASLNGWSGTKVRTMLGRSSRQTIDDLLYLRGVDLGFVNADEMANLRVTNPDHPAIGRLAYVTKVFDSELHLVVRKDSGLEAIQDLAGLRVSVGAPNSDTSLTARLVLRLLGVRASGVFLDTHESLEALRRSEIDAVFYVGPAPSPVLAEVLREDSFKLANVPYTESFAGIYNPAEVSSETYPELVDDKYVETISVPTILAIYNNFPPSSARYKNLVSFTDAFLASIPRLGQPPRHPKWREIDLDARVEGWEQFQYFTDAVARIQ